MGATASVGTAASDYYSADIVKECKRQLTLPMDGSDANNAKSGAESIDFFRKMLMPIIGEDDKPKFDDTEAGKQAELSFFRKLLAKRIRAVETCTNQGELLTKDTTTLPDVPLPSLPASDLVLSLCSDPRLKAVSEPPLAAPALLRQYSEDEDEPSYDSLRGDVVFKGKGGCCSVPEDGMRVWELQSDGARLEPATTESKVLTLPAEYTFCVWMKTITKDVTNAWTGLVVADTDMALALEPKTRRVAIYSDGKAFVTPCVPPSGRWCCLVVTGKCATPRTPSRTGTSTLSLATVDENGELDIQSVGTLRVVSSGLALRSVGDERNVDSTPIMLSQVHLWHRELSPSEIQTACLTGALEHGIYSKEKYQELARRNGLAFGGTLSVQSAEVQRVGELLKRMYNLREGHFEAGNAIADFSGYGFVRTEEELRQVLNTIASLGSRVGTGSKPTTSYKPQGGLTSTVTANSPGIVLSFANNQCLTPTHYRRQLVAFIRFDWSGCAALKGIDLRQCAGMVGGDLQRELMAAFEEVLHMGRQVWVPEAWGTDLCNAFLNDNDKALESAARVEAQVKESLLMEQSYSEQQETLATNWTQEGITRQLAQQSTRNGGSGNGGSGPRRRMKKKSKKYKGPRLTDEQMAKLKSMKNQHQKDLDQMSSAMVAEKNGGLRAVKGVSSAMIMAHFNFIVHMNNHLIPKRITDPDKFDLKKVWSPPSAWGLVSLQDGVDLPVRAGCQLLQKAMLMGLVKIVKATGKSYNIRALTLTLRSTSPLGLHVQVHRGTVFQHTDWVHKQNLMVARTVIVKLKPGETVETKMDAYCMNSMCACSSGEVMQLTEFCLAPKLHNKVLITQQETWNHLGSGFRQKFD